MAAPFIAEIRPWACNFAPYGWAMCQGQVLPISQYTALFSLIGTYYGGNGTSNFALPNLQSRVPIHFGQGPGLPPYDLGEEGGVENVTLTTLEMPVHSHTFTGTNVVGPRAAPADGAALGTSNHGQNFYATDGSSLVAINAATLSPYAGGNLPHSNIQPYLAINWCIALNGIFPARQ